MPISGQEEARGTRIRFVLWQDDRHDQALRTTAEALFAEIEQLMDLCLASGYAQHAPELRET